MSINSDEGRFGQKFDWSGINWELSSASYINNLGLNISSINSVSVNEKSELIINNYHDDSSYHYAYLSSDYYYAYGDFTIVAKLPNSNSIKLEIGFINNLDNSVLYLLSGTSKQLPIIGTISKFNTGFDNHYFRFNINESWNILKLHWTPTELTISCNSELVYCADDSVIEKINDPEFRISPFIATEWMKKSKVASLLTVFKSFYYKPYEYDLSNNY